MSSRDLQSHLYGENGFTERLGKYIAGELPEPHDNPKGPHVLSCWFQSLTDNGRQPVIELPVRELVSPDMLAKEIHHRVMEVYGVSPDGTLYVRVNKPGEASRPAVRFERKCVSAETEAEDPSFALVKNLLNTERIARQQMHSETTAILGQMAASNAQLSSALATLATARGGASAAGDMGSIGSVIGLGALILFLPSLKRTLGLDENASVDDVFRRVGAMFERNLKGSEDRQKALETADRSGSMLALPELDAPPPAAGEEEEEPAGASEGVKAGGPPGGAVTPEALLELAPGEARWLLESLHELSTDPKKYQNALVNAAVAGGIDLAKLAELQKTLSP